MMRGSHGHEKEYVVRVDRPVTGEFAGKMAAGVYLEELDVTYEALTKSGSPGKENFMIDPDPGTEPNRSAACANIRVPWSENCAGFVS